MDREKNLDRATQIVVAYASNNQFDANRLPEIIGNVFNSLQGIEKIGTTATPRKELSTPNEPAVRIEDSITDDFIICLEDGKKLKMLKRYIRTNYGLSPDEYKRRWGLDSDYPLVAPSYSKLRSSFAKKKGLGKRS